MKNSPKLRFPEFANSGEWVEKELRNIITYFKGFAFQSKDYTSNGRRIVRVSDMGFDYIKDETNAIYIDEQQAKEFEKWKLQKNDLVITTVGSKPPVYDSLVGRTIIVQTKDEDSLLNQNAVCLRAKKIEQGFLNVLFKRSEYVLFIESIIRGNANQGSIALEDLFKYICFIPSSINEQQKIADCLSSVDSLILAQSQKVELLKEHKKGLLQNLFPREGESVPRLRFHEFVNDGEWEEKELGDLLDYEQPTSYLVNDTNYNDSFKMPVLTAGKTFILGYTNETHGIFQNPLPVIIFDDFTTATQFVNFPFKAKSSAMKILKSKGDFANIKIIFELMQMIEYQANEHKRYWISEYQNLIVKIPKPKEQQKIADCLSSLDEQISQQTSKLQTLKEHKKALMQQLFPSSETTK